MRKTIAMLLGAAMFPIATLASAQAPTYPDKPIRIVVPFPVGGVADTFGREIGRKLTEAWGQPVYPHGGSGPEAPFDPGRYADEQQAWRDTIDRGQITSAIDRYRQARNALHRRSRPGGLDRRR